MSSPLYSGPKRREEKRREAHPSRAKKRCNISSPIKLASHGLPKQKNKK
jgi:hypothetical protein